MDNNQSYPNPNPQNTSSLATASLVCGILSFFVGGIITAILAIIFANLSKRDTNGVLCSSAKAGKICGIINICIGVVALVIIVALVFSGLLSSNFHVRTLIM